MSGGRGPRQPRNRENASMGATLRGLLEQALRIGAESLEVEYEHGREIVYARVGSLGTGIASIESSSAEGTSLREELAAMTRRTTLVRVSGIDVALRTSTWDSFGECSFRVQIVRSPGR